MTYQSSDDKVFAEMGRRKTKGRWGGPRPGSGRKPVLEDPYRVTFDLEDADFTAVKAIADQRGVSVAEVLRGAVRTYVRRARK